MTSTPPVIIEQQPEDYTGAVGDTATFTVSATGDGLIYQWQYSSDGGANWANSSSSGSTANTLSIGILAYRTGYLYRCVITDSLGHSVISQPGQLTVVSGTSVMSLTAQTLRITDQPDDYYGTDGDTATFVVAATGSGLTYRWEYSDTGGAYWWDSSAQGAATGTLQIGYAANRVGYLYRCIITDADGNTVISRTAEIKAAAYGTWSFTYNADGMRTERSNGTTTYRYVYNGSSLVQMTVGSDTLYFTSDTVTLNETTYYYVKNLQGDVVAILDANGIAVVQYTYDAWGNILSTSDTSGVNLGMLNPLRYRGYVYDEESGLYYLQSRYYDPEIGRFINADALVSTGQGLLGNNMFAYCGNNPINRVDPSGYFHYIYNEGGDKYEFMYGLAKASGGGGGGCGGWNPGVNVPKLNLNAVDEAIAYICNTDEQVVLDADYLAFYKGVPVIKLPIGTDAFSFGIIFMGNEVGNRSDAKETVMHEYGHNVHFRQIGLINYFIYVAVPSLIGYWTDIPYEKYYSQPYEYIADLFGNVDRQPYSYSSATEDWWWIYWATTL